ncbi:MAG: biotin/lipoyl-containing protein [Pseudomonadota bacterium]|nr:biotin/lipoyl-containing protein [Pseudomonadota bacterium]
MSKLDKKKIIDDINELSKLMIKNNLSELEISNEKITYRMKKNLLENKSNHLIEKETQTENKEEKNKKTESSLKSPLVGTAYLSPEPGTKKFIEIGQTVKIGQVLLIVEAMKTMNEIVADRNGVVKRIYVKNEAPVEFGEPLVLIE